MAAAAAQHGVPGMAQKASVRPVQRKFLDIIDLAASGFEVKVSEERQDELYVKLHVDPARIAVDAETCPYVGGVWWLRIELPERYPSSSPSVAFVNRIFHPNVEERSGSICLDVLNQTWSPMFTLTHALSHFLTQLLSYPNPQDPMNGEAAALHMQDQRQFAERVRQHAAKHATEEAAAAAVARETQGRSFYEPDVDAVRKRQRRNSASESGTPSQPSLTPGTPMPASLPSSSASSVQPSELDRSAGSARMEKDDDDVSEASDIDLDMD
eukprot:TRINITY_DN18723_c0_g1_i1.p2 TRINITY_DN18723_c0_g1~~TRINITY_DN18723_c0_g1_i1.p2  ORF type:complete len:269 (+),score=95.61 TRINITY_DN18723_c0_g1_i1:144-950(+)